LLNRFTGAGVLVENALFATLDPTVRKTESSEGETYTFVDTVGFVRHLPHQLVEAFKSTLEEVSGSDLILHIVDGSHIDPLGQIDAVREVLDEIGARAIPEIIVINKADIADPDTIDLIRRRESRTMLVSAFTGEGIPELLTRVEAELPKRRISLELLIPYSRGDLLHLVHEFGEVHLELHGEEGTTVEAHVDRKIVERIKSELQLS
jgi:GTP-binding protein HflX